MTALTPAIRGRVLRDWAHVAGVPKGQLSATHLAAIDALVVGWRGQGPIALPGGFEVIRTSGTLCLRVAEPR
jgi:tRNA(Ile)-lysidine synthase